MQEFMKELRHRFRQNKFGIVDFDRHVLLAACTKTVRLRPMPGSAATWRGAFTWALGEAINGADRRSDLQAADPASRGQPQELRAEATARMLRPKLRTLQVFSTL